MSIYFVWNFVVTYLLTLILYHKKIKEVVNSNGKWFEWTGTHTFPSGGFGYFSRFEYRINFNKFNS